MIEVKLDENINAYKLNFALGLSPLQLLLSGLGVIVLALVFYFVPEPIRSPLAAWLGMIIAYFIFFSFQGHSALQFLRIVYEAVSLSKTKLQYEDRPEDLEIGRAWQAWEDAQEQRQEEEEKSDVL